MTPNEFQQRTKQFALRVFKLHTALPRTDVAATIGRQLIRCAASVGANYRSACRARSRADFVAKMSIVEEESDECVYWLELLADSGHIKPTRLTLLMKEARELTALASASRMTARRRANTPPNRQSTIDSRQSP